MFPPAYMLCLLYFIFITFPCIIGAVLEKKSDAFLEKLKKVSWRKLDVSDQKSFQLVMLFAQRIGSITCFMIPLNQSALIKIYDKIYSYTLILMNFEMEDN